MRAVGSVVRGTLVVLAGVTLALGAGACADDGREEDDRSVDGDGAAVEDPVLRAELLEMLERDQAARADMDGDWERADAENQARLVEILDEHGWPGWTLVGEDGSTAAWAIAQHADLDLDLQRRSLELLRTAVDAGDASPGDLAYLEDRVRVAEGRPQRYGTQWEPGAGGEWRPRTPIEDEDGVDARRAAAGLEPLEDYLDQLRALDG